MNISDRILFLKYALPCAGTLVKRGSVSQEEWDDSIRNLSNGHAKPGAENTFKVATAFCTLMAKDAGESEISENTIRRYFLSEHDTVVDRRAEEMGDFLPDDCRIYAGKVADVAENRAIVETQRGKLEYRTDFCKVREGDTVVVHWDFVVEHVDLDTAKALWNAKKIYFPEAEDIF